MIRTLRHATGSVGLTAALILVGPVSAQAADWGTLKGKFVYDGTPPAAAKIDVTKDAEVCGKHPLVDESLVVDAGGGVANGLSGSAPRAWK